MPKAVLIGLKKLSQMACVDAGDSVIIVHTNTATEFIALKLEMSV